MPSYVRPGIRKCAKNRALSRSLATARQRVLAGLSLPKTLSLTPVPPASSSSINFSQILLGLCHVTILPKIVLSKLHSQFLLIFPVYFSHKRKETTFE